MCVCVWGGGGLGLGGCELVIVKMQKKSGREGLVVGSQNCIIVKMQKEKRNNVRPIRDLNPRPSGYKTCTLIHYAKHYRTYKIAVSKYSNDNN